MSVGDDNTSDRDRDRARSQALLGDGLELDLRKPLSREDVGLPDGRTSVVRQLPDREPFEATVTFADDRVLNTSATTLMAQSLDDTSPPDTVDLVRPRLSEADFKAALDQAVTDFGADRSDVTRLLAEARRAPGSGRDLQRPLRTDVEGLTLNVVVTAMEGHRQVSYTMLLPRSS